MERNTYNKADYPHGSRYIWELRKCNSVTFLLPLSTHLFIFYNVEKYYLSFKVCFGCLGFR